MTLHNVEAQECDSQPGTSDSAALPQKLRLLCVSAREPSWISLTLQLDAARCQEPHFRWVSSLQTALTVLHEESFDCILVGDADGAEQNGGRLDPLALLRAVRGSGFDEPVILVTGQISDDRWGRFSSEGCDVLVTSHLWESKALLPIIKRAIGRAELARENHRLLIAQHRRLVRERDEAEHLLDQQRRIIEQHRNRPAPAGTDGEAASDGQRDGPLSDGPGGQGLPREVGEFYSELLRTYVIMGSGTLGTEIAKLSELIVTAGLGPREAMQFHLAQVESLVGGLGNRSARHVMARADLLAMELVVHVGECYRRQARLGRQGAP